MTLQELCDYYDSHPELQEEIRANVWEWRNEKNRMMIQLGNDHHFFFLPIVMPINPPIIDNVQMTIKIIHK